MPKEQKDALVTQHVLSRFSKEEMGWVEPVLDRVAEALPVMLKDGIDKFRMAL